MGIKNVPTEWIETIPVNKALQRVNQLAKATDTPLYEDIGDMQYTTLKDFKGVRNDKIGRVVGIVSKGYTIIQHEEAFKPVIESMALGNEKVMFSLVEEDKKAYLYCGMPKEYDLPDGSKLQLGFLAVNGYDGGTAFTVSAFGYRHECMNAFVLRKALGTVSIRHFGEVKYRLQQFHKLLEKNMGSLFEAISKRREEEITQHNARQYLKQQYGARVGEEIYVHWVRNEEPNIWGVINSITNFYTHRQINERMKIKKLAKAETLLLEGYKAPNTKGE